MGTLSELISEFLYEDNLSEADMKSIRDLVRASNISLEGSGPPSSSDVAEVGEIYKDTTQLDNLYICVSKSPQTWMRTPFTNDEGEIVGPIIITPMDPASSATYVPRDGEIISTDGYTDTISTVVYEFPGFIQIGNGVDPGIALGIVGPRPVKYVRCDLDNDGLGTQENRLPIDPRYDYVITYYGNTDSEIGLSGEPGLGQRFTFISCASNGVLETDDSDATQEMFLGPGDTYPVYGFAGHSNVDTSGCTGTFAYGGILDIEIAPHCGWASWTNNLDDWKYTMIVRNQLSITWSEP